MADTAREGSMEDVLASIRRLVSEETDRVPESAPERVPDAPAAATGPAPPGPGPGPRRSARAKLLLTDAFLVDEADRWGSKPVPEAAEPAPVARPEPERSPPDGKTGATAPSETAPAPRADHHPHNPPRAETRTAAARGRAVYDDADQEKVVREVENFLTRTRDQDRPESPADLPPLDARARQDRTVGRSPATDGAAEASTVTALQKLFRSGQKGALADPEPDSPAADTGEPEAVETGELETVEPEPARARPSAARPLGEPRPTSAVEGPEPVLQAPPQAGEPMVPIAMIEQAVKASLERYAAPDPVAAPEPAGELVFDEEVLREMVARIVKQELQGSLGERITRNVRKLVRREIYRALEARDLG